MSMAAIGLANAEYFAAQARHLRGLKNPHRLIPNMIAQADKELADWCAYTRNFKRDLTRAEKKRFTRVLKLVKRAMP